MDLLVKAEETAKRCLELEACTTDWTKVKETRDCIVYSKPSPDLSGHHLYRSEGLIPFSPEKVFAYTYAGVEKPKREEWDPTVTNTAVIERVSSDVDVILSQTASAVMGLIGAREFVDLVKIIHEPERIITAAISIEHPDVPHSAHHVRAFNHPSATFCYRISGKPDETRFIQLVQTDIRGKIPTSLVESAIPSNLAGTYSHVKRALAKEKY
ncbi:stAR-related lipid transfer protein 5-like [Paramacrobiotus metropolitanus]|uniref:stAR-related lipid transfer protein 5-like n=1 Tax=Paramacrobiotus metropolitanus TaxID=2943436 RepID=UPI002445DDF8|nr:stAR-related lipid transfer protein 5-like [Paramacrobiotus metropolitanus]